MHMMHIIGSILAGAFVNFLMSELHALYRHCMPFLCSLSYVLTFSMVFNKAYITFMLGYAYIAGK